MFQPQRSLSQEPLHLIPYLLPLNDCDSLSICKIIPGSKGEKNPAIVKVH